MKQRKAAELLATSTGLTLADIAKQAGTTVLTLKKWREKDEFAGYVRDLQADSLGDTLRLPGVAKAERIRILSDLVVRLLELAGCRAKLNFPDPVEQQGYEDHGGKTGLVVAKKRLVGSADYGLIVTDYSLDSAFVKEIRETLKQLALEAGDLTIDVDEAQRGTINIVFRERSDSMTELEPDQTRRRP